MNINYEFLEDYWIKGDCGNYTFQAKVYDEPSNYGINMGVVSKLLIKDDNGEWVVNYDRGWDISPNKEVKPIYNKILKLLENLE